MIAAAFMGIPYRIETDRDPIEFSSALSVESAEILENNHILWARISVCPGNWSLRY